MAVVIPGVKFSQFQAAGQAGLDDIEVGLHAGVNAKFNSTSFKKTVTQVAHGFILGNIIYVIGIAGVDVYRKSQANSLANSELTIGVVISIPDANTFTIQFGGYVSIPGLAVPLTPGALYYLDPVTAGTVTEIKPIAAGQVVKPLLVTDSLNSFYWLNQVGTLL